LAILSALHGRYIDSKGNERKAVINDGVKEITASAEKDGVAVPPALRKVRSLCIKHFHIHTNSPAESHSLVSERPSEETRRKCQDLQDLQGHCRWP
jgi:hypothetical protein